MAKLHLFYILEQNATLSFSLYSMFGEWALFYLFIDTEPSYVPHTA